MIRHVEISNFKSIRSLSLNCKKINIFIGKPNVGKSNILESLTAFGNLNAEGVRYQVVRNLFYDQDIGNLVKIKIDKHEHIIRSDFKSNDFFSYFLNNNNLIPSIKNIVDNKLKEKKERPISFEKLDAYDGKGKKSIQFRDISYNLDFDHGSKMQGPTIKKYTFKDSKSNPSDSRNNDTRGDTLRNPYGENIFSVLKNDRELLKEVSDLFKEYGYSLIIDFVSNEAEIQKLVDNIGFKIPYSLVADTLQRMVFYIVAIRSNSNCTLLLEEPENHSFPPYIRDIALEIAKSNNQFFIATHSPYLLNTLLSECPNDELSLNVVSYENFETKIKTLSEDQISEMMNFGIDAFFNIDSLLNE